MEFKRLLVPLPAAFLGLVPLAISLLVPFFAPFVGLVPLPTLFLGVSALVGKDLGFEAVRF